MNSISCFTKLQQHLNPELLHGMTLDCSHYVLKDESYDDLPCSICPRLPVPWIPQVSFKYLFCCPGQLNDLVIERVSQSYFDLSVL